MAEIGWTQERTQKFWERCGLKEVKSGFRGDPFGISTITIPQHLPEITDLNALFRWAVPVYVMKTGRDFMTIPTTLSPEKLAVAIAEAIEKALEEPKCPK